ncbi:HAMP domain-containing methyl-accepting chemotaxis protein [Spirochaeta cellobiosiphila]|uniref:HAMP domain-containing methyl-accepting chemotaxis protein n=1 Tax=Spirochaeta cellobiosiphila TaxID=504483 RepID=UPI00040899E3|nr:methyl-accepting chemotaxis protein [Spirochaeta cellobiosiphila]
MKIRSKFIILGGVPLAAIILLFLMGVLGFRDIQSSVVQANSIQQDQTMMVDSDRDGYQALLALTEAIKDENRDKISQYKADYLENSEQTLKRIQEPGQRFSPDMLTGLNDFLEHYSLWDNLSKEVLTLVEETAQSNTEREKAMASSSQAFLTMRDVIDRVGETLDNQLDTALLRQASNLIINGDRDAYQAYLAQIQTDAISTDQELKELEKVWMSNSAQTKERITEGFRLVGLANSIEMSTFNDQYDLWQSEGLRSFQLLESTLNKNQKIASLLIDVQESFSLLHDTVDQLRGYQDTRVEEVLAGLYKNIAGTSTLYLFISLLALGITVSLVFITSQNIIKAAVKSMEFADSIAEGDLDVELHITQKDELGQLANSLTQMIKELKYKSQILDQIAEGDLRSHVELASERDALGQSLSFMSDSLNKLMKNIRTVASQVSSGANQIAQASQNLSQGATEQASALEDINGSVHELESHAIENVSNAEQARSKASGASHNAVNGKEHMAGLIAVMTKINESADAIDGVVKIVDDIAFQINLLALNANVEAARAGKYGKGFGVVADEVGRLAERSAQSVKEISEMVRQTVEKIKQGDEAAQITAKHLDSIVDDTLFMSDLMDRIVEMSKDQSEKIRDITKGISQIDQVTQGNTASAEESAAASEELASQAEELTNVVKQFQLRTNQQEQLLLAQSKY